MREVFESTLEKLLADNITQELLLASEESGWFAPLWELVDSSGFAYAAAPEAAGGADACWDDLYSVIQLCGRYALPLPLPEAILANWLLAVSGMECLGGALSFAAEHDLRWSGQGLTGSVCQVPWGRHCDHIVAIVAGESPTVVVLDPRAATDCTLTTNLAAEPRDNFTYANYSPLASGQSGAGLDAAVLLRGGAMLRSAQIAGALDSTLSMAAQYTSDRVQFGRPIGKFQAVQHQLAVLAEHTAAARVSAQSAFAESTSSVAVLPAMVAKICTSEAASIGGSVGHGVHGAIGFTQEYALHTLTRRLWAWRSEYGSSTYWSQKLGAAVCNEGSAAFWPTITSGELKQ